MILYNGLLHLKILRVFVSVCCAKLPISEKLYLYPYSYGYVGAMPAMLGLGLDGFTTFARWLTSSAHPIFKAMYLDLEGHGVYIFTVRVRPLNQSINHGDIKRIRQRENLHSRQWECGLRR